MNSSDTSDKNATPQEPIKEEPESSAESLEFAKKLEELATSEEKIAFGLSHMREDLSQEGSPRFREFWDSRRLILPLFKTNLNPVVREKLWEEYIELTQEARRLKEVLEEHSAFVLEQIELAIDAVEKDLARFEEILQSAEKIEFSPTPYSLRPKVTTYEEMQKELTLLNAFASRVNALRKEIMKTGMRIRFKTKLFKQLSRLGDLIFPRRKSQIERLSEVFQKDVDHFVSKHFKGEEVVGAPYYALREEIKSFQSMAKALTLNSQSFSQTRLILSKCWDQIKRLDLEYKKANLEKKEASAEALNAIRTKVEELKTRSSEMSLKDLNQEIGVLSTEMKEIYIDKEDIKALKEAFVQMRAPHLEAQEKKRQELEAAAKENQRMRKEKIVQLKEQATSLLSSESSTEFTTEFEKAFSSLQEEIKKLHLSSVEKRQIEQHMRPLKDLFLEKKEKALMNLSDDEQKTLENYRVVLQQRKDRRAQVKEQVDTYRKMLGASGLDFEKSLELTELLDEEKLRLEKAHEAVDELEQKIAEFEG